MYVYVCMCILFAYLVHIVHIMHIRAYFLQAKVLVGRYSTDTGNTYNIHNI